MTGVLGLFSRKRGSINSGTAFGKVSLFIRVSQVPETKAQQETIYFMLVSKLSEL
jgi:hypothetical protein